MSKLSQLKQDAYQAAKGRDWTTAVSVYEQILEIDKKNPTVVNELGDICLKAGEVHRAVRSFLNAASMYRKNGLLNNAVAIYKKILRHEEKNLNAHWYLAETRASQGLKVEGEQHGMVFLENSGEVSGDLKEIFLKRCVTLFELFPESELILEKLVQIFRMWEMNLEAARAQILLCCLAYDKGETEQATQDVEKVVAKEPSVANYPEYAQWSHRLNPQTKTDGGAFESFGSVDLGGTKPADAGIEPGPTPTPEAAPANVPPPVAEPSFADMTAAPEAAPESVPEAAPEAPSVVSPEAAETGFADVKIDPDPVPAAAEDPLDVAKDEDGCISIDTGDGSALQDILAAAVSEAADAIEEGEPSDPPSENADETAADPVGEQVDLLAQILAEDGDDILGTDSDQLKTITAEIGAQVGGDEDADQPDRLYEMGMVYLEMGMHDQACESFAKAAVDPEYTARAYEMWSTTLLRANREQEAVEILNKGLQVGELDDSGKLGLLYHLGQAHEKAGGKEEATVCYEKIVDQDPNYLDANRRLDRLTAPI